ncbi:MAG: formate/nitrite transporter family protein [Pseudolabrys sp.]|jgi:formate/nitrite transporter FocA (FNT family)
MPAGSQKKSGDKRLSKAELEEIEDHLRLPVPLVYHIIRAEGNEELARPLGSLLWSGVAAGLSISMSVVVQGLLLQKLSETPWRPLIVYFGYCTGFLIVVLGRLQLFTENTITAVLPLLLQPSCRKFLLVARLWGIVLAANLVGTLLFGFATRYLGIFTSEQIEAFLLVSRHFMEKGALEMLLHGIPAGFLIAAMVWMIPSARGLEFFVIILMTYAIALGNFSHVIAGSAEAFLLLAFGEIGAWKTVAGFLVPAFVGNVLGGTVLFTLLAYGQVREEL